MLCTLPRCRRPSILEYHANGVTALVCALHWAKHCDPSDPFQIAPVPPADNGPVTHAEAPGALRPGGEDPDIKTPEERPS